MKRLSDDISLIALIALVGLALVLLLIPILVSIVMSFDGRSFMGAFPPPEYSFRWYEKFFSDNFYLRGLKTSMILATLAAVVSTAIGVSAAIFLGPIPTSRGKMFCRHFSFRHSSSQPLSSVSLCSCSFPWWVSTTASLASSAATSS